MLKSFWADFSESSGRSSGLDSLSKKLEWQNVGCWRRRKWFGRTRVLCLLISLRATRCGYLLSTTSLKFHGCCTDVVFQHCTAIIPLTHCLRTNILTVIRCASRRFHPSSLFLNFVKKRRKDERPRKPATLWTTGALSVPTTTTVEVLIMHNAYCIMHSFWALKTEFYQEHQCS
jgi:hypothetical protein